VITQSGIAMLAASVASVTLSPVAVSLLVAVFRLCVAVLDACVFKPAGKLLAWDLFQRVALLVSLGLFSVGFVLIMIGS